MAYFPPISGQKVWLFSLFYPLLFISTIALVVYFLGVGKFEQADLSSLFYMPTVLGLLLALGLLFGEEYGWRGFLLHELLQHRSISQAAIITGLVWALWHAPLVYTLATMLGTSSPLLLMLVQSGAVFVFSFAFTHAYLLAYSIWPPMLLHYVWNLYNPVVLGNIYQNESGIISGNLMLINGEALAGIALGLPFMVWFFYRYRSKA